MINPKHGLWVILLYFMYLFRVIITVMDPTRPMILECTVVGQVKYSVIPLKHFLCSDLGKQVTPLNTLDTRIVRLKMKKFILDTLDTNIAQHYPMQEIICGMF